MSPDETKTNGFLVLLKESILGSYPTTIWGTWIGFIGQPESYTNSQNLGLQNDGILYQNVIEMQRLPCPNPLLACVNVRFYGQLKSREATCYIWHLVFSPKESWCLITEIVANCNQCLAEIVYKWSENCP